MIKCDHTSMGWGRGGTIPGKVGKVGKCGCCGVLRDLLLASFGRQAASSLKSWASFPDRTLAKETLKEVAPWHVQIDRDCRHTLEAVTSQDRDSPVISVSQTWGCLEKDSAVYLSICLFSQAVNHRQTKAHHQAHARKDQYHFLSCPDT